MDQHQATAGGLSVLIADDHDLLRETLEIFLGSEGGITPQSAKDLPAALDLIKRAGPFDLVLLDFDMPGMNGLAGLTEAIAANGGKGVALISGVADRDIAEKALASGAAGFLPKTLAAKSLVAAVRFMAMGEKYAPLDFMTQEPKSPEHPLARKLSAREMQVLEGLTQGKSNKEIARDLDVQEPTVKLHVKTLYRKLGAANRTQAALIARDAGLF
jgi:DNA-binding NarL/FixJ family response regulator